MRLGRTKDEAELAVAEAKDELKRATGRLEEAVKERRKRFEAAQKQLGRAHDDYRKRIERAERSVTEAGQSRKVGGGLLGPVKLYDDRIVVNGKTHSLTQVQATVDTAGNLSRTRRHTLTRFALLGPLSLFAPKKTKHDDRELFLLVEGPDWAELVKFDIRQQASTRQLAQSITVAARQVEQTRADRRERVATAQAELGAARADNASIEAARQDVTAAHAATEAILARRDELVELLARYGDQESKEARKARELVSGVQGLLAEQLELPRSPATELVAAPATLELEVGRAAVSEPIEPELRRVEGSGNGDVIEQIKRLGELRDAGLVTPEEFEEKKAELLARL